MQFYKVLLHPLKILLLFFCIKRKMRAVFTNFLSSIHNIDINNLMTKDLMKWFYSMKYIYIYHFKD